MHIFHPPYGAASVAARCLVEALGVGRFPDQLHGLPMPAVIIPERGVMIAATSAPAPIFRGAVEQHAVVEGLDALLLRVGDPDDGRLPMLVDATLALRPCAPWSLQALHPWMGADDTLWLVSDAGDPAISLTPMGLTIELVLPFDNPIERDLGIDLAAWTMARLLDPEAQ